MHRLREVHKITTDMKVCIVGGKVKGIIATVVNRCQVNIILVCPLNNLYRRQGEEKRREEERREQKKPEETRRNQKRREEKRREEKRREEKRREEKRREEMR